MVKKIGDKDYTSWCFSSPKKSTGSSENTAKCMILVDDCWEKTLNKLSVKEILKLGATCKEMLRICGN